jgi:putative chitinase
MTPEQLHQILPNLKYYDQICKAINDTCEMFEINTRNRVCHFLAQILHESGGLRYTTELASGAQYEGRKDLGNINAGDGKLFKGRGYIQITGRYNYNLLSKALGIDFISCPEKLAQHPYNMFSAGWFWNLKGLNKWADLNNITQITKLINGGLTGFKERKKWLEICFRAIQ